MILPHRTRSVVLASVLALCAAVGCAPGRSTPPNVVVILVDTLRADRLGAYGNARGLTPFLDALAARGVVYRRAYAAGSWTQPSVASLFTSRFQSQHGVVLASAEVDEDEVTLAEVLHQHGYATGAFSANALIAKRFGYGQGFDEYVALWGRPEDMHAKYRAEDMNALAVQWLEKRNVAAGTPFFLYVHYLEPHTPYSPPAAMLDRTVVGRAHPDVGDVSKWLNWGNYGHPNPEQLRDIVDVYDAEVASVDAGIRALCDSLERMGVLDDTILVVTADHGEAFLEHGVMGHGNTLYEEAIHVPLLLVPAGGTKHVDVDAPVSLLDVAPTVLDLLGLAAPEAFEGRSILPDATRPRRWFDDGPEPRRAAADRPVFSEHIIPESKATARLRPHERAVITKDAKVIVGVAGERESFDLAVDPGEHTPLPDARVTALAETLEAFRARVAVASHDTPQVDPELRQRLQALGYFD